MLNGSDPVLISLVNPSVTVQRLDEREKILEPFKGKQNDFQLNVSANKTVYYDNEELQIALSANADCYFVVYHLDIDNNMQVIYPNKWEQDNHSHPYSQNFSNGFMFLGYEVIEGYSVRAVRSF